MQCIRAKSTLLCFVYRLLIGLRKCSVRANALVVRAVHVRLGGECSHYFHEHAFLCILKHLSSLSRLARSSYPFHYFSIPDLMRGRREDNKTLGAILVKVEGSQRMFWESFSLRISAQGADEIFCNLSLTQMVLAAAVDVVHILTRSISLPGAPWRCLIDEKISSWWR